MALNETQLANTKAYIGGSRAASCLGLDPYKPAYESFLELTGQLAPVDLSGSELVMMGELVEGAIAEGYMRKRGVKLRRSNVSLFHKKYPFIVAHPDRIAVGEKFGVEIKNRGAYREDEYGEDGSDQVLDTDFIQCTVYMAVTELPEWRVVPLFGGNKIREFILKRDMETENQVLAGLADFWNLYVQTKTPPPLDYDHPRTLELLQRQHRDVKPLTVDAPLDLLPWCATFEDSKRRIKEYTNAANAAKARILETIGTAGALLLPDGTTYNRKVVAKKEYTVAATSYVELRRKAPKGAA